MHRPPRSCRNGFALVLALALTGLVFALVLVFAAWVQFSARAVALGKEKAHARDLAYLAIKEALFELNTYLSDDACLIVDRGCGKLDAYLPQGGRMQSMMDHHRSWMDGDEKVLACGYSIRIYDGNAKGLELPVGGMLTSVHGGFKENLKASLESDHPDSESVAFGDSIGVYGPSWGMLRSYADVCGSWVQRKELKPQGHGPFGCEGCIPAAISEESFLQTTPKILDASGRSERGDPILFGVYPCLLSMDVRYGLEVTQSEFYYMPRIVEHVSLRLYNPYDVPLALAHYKVKVSGSMPDLAISVGGGNSMSALLKDSWEFSVALNPSEEKLVELPSRVVFEFPSMPESLNALRVGLGGALPQVKPSLSPQGSGRSLRDAFFNKRKERSQATRSKPTKVSQLHFYLEGADRGLSLLQRVNEASLMTFDLSSPTRAAIEKRVWELPHLGGLAQSGEQALFAWNYTANGMLSNPSALLASASGLRAVGEKKEVLLPRGIYSRMDFEPGLRSFYGSGPVILGEHVKGSLWNDVLSTALWDTYFYPLGPECYTAVVRGASVEAPIDPRYVLLKGAFSVNTLDAFSWERFLKKHASWLGQEDVCRLAEALSAVLKERIPLRSMADFWAEQGVFAEAVRRGGLDEEELRRLKGDICEYLAVRPDTFIVRGQGAFGDSEAFCEAVVQRVPETSSPKGRIYRRAAFRWIEKNLSPQKKVFEKDEY